MKKILLLILFALFIMGISAEVYAVEGFGSLISPGPLAKAHEKYDGIQTCTKCHKLGGGVPDKNCLDCHDKLAKRIKEKKTIHARYTESCIKCHRDHKGLDFKMISLDEDSFKHKETGYKLEGGHAKTKCGKCHKKESYAGLKKDCLSCHKDFHKKQLSSDCFKCHNFASWKDIKKFSHDRDSKYKITGKHKKVKCAKCHKKKKYKLKRYRLCDSCHKDPHKKDKAIAKKTCAGCHVTDSWKKVKIDHGKTRYPLTGKHIKTTCQKCHKKSKLTGIPFATCDSSSCHKDPHKRQFKGKKCDSCHKTKGWKPSLFEHNAPSYEGYKLEGKHLKTECKKCHKKGKYKRLKYKTCSTSDCHKDPHKRQFRGKKCESCHKVAGWKPSLFDHNAPGYDGFRLEGKHLKTACDKCHKKGRYKNVSTRCLKCHKKDNVHKRSKWNKCEKCHDAKSWKKSSFDHNKQSKFPLIGKHKKAKCKKCHKDKTYKAKGKICSECHKDVHKGEFKEGCDNCHTQVDWDPRSFPHGVKTSFKLKGVHKGLICKDCHKTKGTFRHQKSACSECHRDPHQNQFGKADCARCHSELSWLMTTFNHSETGYPLIGKHRFTQCVNCHANGQYARVGAFCASCHEKDYQTTINHQARSYSLDCIQCHNADFKKWNFNHKAISSGCATCHASYSNPAQSPNHAIYNWNVIPCEQCHRNTSMWIFAHPAGTTGCATCHLNYTKDPKSTNHTTYSWNAMPCEQCHQSKVVWTFIHPAATMACSICHANFSNPVKSAKHGTNNWTICEDCHKSTAVWTFIHPTAISNCDTCHPFASDPPLSAKHTAFAGVSCEVCHKSTASWLPFTHPVVTTGCSTCHLNYSNPPKPAFHTANNWVTCEQCHRTGVAVWTFTHPLVGVAGCANCHLNMSNPPKPADHNANNWVICENCHSPGARWTYNHPPTTFPRNHEGTNPNDCTACHVGGNYTNPIGCIECHRAEGEDTHRNKYSNQQCINCHPTGRD